MENKTKEKNRKITTSDIKKDEPGQNRKEEGRDSIVKEMPKNIGRHGTDPEKNLNPEE
jgi:hypothetical protein